jgi:prepilin-type N-terminal cleavage/methylation domain-containing protein
VTNEDKTQIESKGFTLIELLIVIVIIGILSGVVLRVINPARQIQKSRETVFRATAGKACLALAACAASTQDAMKCNTDVLIGFAKPAGDPGTYTVTPAALSTGTVLMTGTYGGCTVTCSAKPSDGTFANFTITGATCLVL